MNRLNKFFAFLAALLIVVSNLYFSRNLYEGFRLPKAFAGMWLIALIVLLYFIARLKTLHRLFLTPVNLLLLAALLLSVLSAGLSRFPGDSYSYLAHFFTFFMLFVVLSDLFRSYPAALAVVFWTLVGTTLLISVYGLLQVANMDPLFVLEESAKTLSVRHRITGITGQTTLFAAILGPVLPLLLGMIPFFPGKPGWLLKAAFAAALVVTIATMSRAVIAGVGLAIAVPVFLMAGKRWYVPLAVLLIMAVLFGGFMLAEPKARERIVSSFSLEQGAISWRLAVWRVSLPMVKDHPLMGTGPGTFPRMFPGYLKRFLDEHPTNITQTTTQSVSRSVALQAHNDVLQNVIETGLLANICLFVALFLILRPGRARSAYVFNQRVPVRSFCLFLRLGILVFMVNALFNFPFHFATSALYFTVFTAAIYALSRGNEA